ncbi:3-ketoacyl-CoA thiolase, mitochondrial [Ctenocephalides felis]|uniref:3-ketoacyl-CoA thiolase, mitochondrial n=1 Tax=Ctenocephalides felis TaxID=7515 RepID=UPI000E6E1BA2|nr:3-ketoacyl-CoA thiolase, mitochondrial [Ctenocephalides felis]
MSAATRGIFIVGAKRTAFGTYGGTLKNHSFCDLQVVASKAALQEAGIKPDQVDSVVIGNVMASSSSDGAFMPRHVSLKCGIPINVPALGVNRLCGSGFQAVVNGAQDILVGAANIVLTGGAESMSQAPFVVRNIRFGTTLGAPLQLEDSLWIGLTDSYCKLPMALTAENLASQYKIPREKVDEFALQSQQKWKKALDEGVFKSEIAPMSLTIKKKEVQFCVDEHPRPQTTLESLSKLPTIFKKDGVVTAGSASGISDGAAAIVLASEESCKQHGLKPLARLVGYSTVGVEPSIMGIGPVPAIENVLKVTGNNMQDIDLFEINEAFGVQTMACAQALNMDTSKLNVNGGAIALGHPLAASGARITAHLVHELRRKGLKKAVGSACIGGGQGIALLVESV